MEKHSQSMFFNSLDHVKMIIPDVLIYVFKILQSTFLNFSKSKICLKIKLLKIIYLFITFFELFFASKSKLEISNLKSDNQIWTSVCDSYLID